MKTITLSLLLIASFLVSCASTSQMESSSKTKTRMAKQKQELEAIGFKVDYISVK